MDEYIRELIAKECERRGITTYRLSKMVGLKRPTSLYLWLGGQRDISYGTFIAILKALDLEITKPFRNR